VAPEDAERIFEPFYQEARQATGARNGKVSACPSCANIAAHDGSVTSAPGRRIFG
jgi:two-component system sensor histidine kinase GlrK